MKKYIKCSMQTVIYLDGKKSTQKKAKELVGEDRFKRMLKEAKENFKKDPYEENSWYIGTSEARMLTIEFC